MEKNKLKVTDFLIIINVILIALNYFVLDGDIKVSITIIILTMYVLLRRFKELKNIQKSKDEGIKKQNRASRRRK